MLSSAKLLAENVFKKYNLDLMTLVSGGALRSFFAQTTKQLSKEQIAVIFYFFFDWDSLDASLNSHYED